MSTDKRSMIVTGGAGFIGSHIARALIEKGYKVWVVDNLSTGFESNIPVGAEFIQLDISDPASYSKLPTCRESDVVFHLAAQSSGETSHDQPQVDLMCNALGTLLILDWCHKNNLRRFLYASSMAIYGDVASLPVKETQECKPLSLYGISKLTAENYINHFAKRGINATIFRIFSAYGPGQDLNNLKQGMVSIYLSFLLNEQPVLVKGSRDRFRDLTYIDDIVKAWLMVMDNKNTFGKTYNLGIGKKTLVSELIEEEIKTFGYNPSTYPVIDADPTPADQFGLYADVSQLESDLGWAPQISLESGLREMVKWAELQREIR